MRVEDIVDVARLDEFDSIVDVRSPAEFAADRIPGAMSCPVLDDAERERVGTLYKQVSSFEAKKVGAALVARNIARHLDERFRDRPRDWRPLVYCWRGGTRSGAMAHILRQVGWKAAQLEGGYKAFRHRVVADLAALPAGFSFTVLCGPTGSAKSRLLEALVRRGAQALDLERLAEHRGSVLGATPDTPQPTQKAFETSIWHALSGFDPSRPVYVEAESRKIGALQVPDALLDRIRASACVRLDIERPARVAFLRREYAHFLERPDELLARLSHLTTLHGHAVIDGWREMAQAGAWDALVEGLLAQHYDPAYERSSGHNFMQIQGARSIVGDDLSPAGIESLAAAIDR